MSSRPVPCPRGHVANFCTPYAPNGLAPRATRPSFSMSLRTSALHPRTRPSFCHVIASQCSGAPQRGTLCGERRPKGSVARLWPLAGAGHGGLWGDEVWQSASPGRNVVHCTCARLRAHLPSLSLHTSAHTGVAIRFPAEELGKLAILRANSQQLRIRPKHCDYLLRCTAKRNGLPIPSPWQWMPRRSAGFARLAKALVDFSRNATASPSSCARFP